MDSLSRVIEKRVEEGKIDSYQVSGDKSISHLFYVDDILIFAMANLNPY